MSDVTVTPVEASSLDPVTEELLRRADAAGIAAEVRELGGVRSPRRRVFVLLSMPSGRSTRRINVFPNYTQRFLDIDFENFIILGDYIAVVDKRTGRIEAQITGSSPGPSSRIARVLQELPGAEVSREDEPTLDGDFEYDEATPTGTPVSTWRLSVKKGDVSIEISPSSMEFETLLGGSVTIKIDGAATSSHDEALELLERYANALLFDLDLIYGISVQVSKRRVGGRLRLRERTDRMLSFPQNQYAKQALQLYQYGRTAGGLPLLEYLAYYQSVEYFFPFFARQHTVNAVRSQLLHPGFDARNDESLNRLINLTAPAGSSGMSEREQLRATIRACVEEGDLQRFLESSEEYLEHFCSAKQKIKGTKPVQIKGNHADLRDQAADRIYAIRCRIVHAKHDGGGSNEEVLLPSGREAASLQADIELLRLIAQWALVARASRA